MVIIKLTDLKNLLKLLRTVEHGEISHKKGLMAFQFLQKSQRRLNCSPVSERLSYAISP